MFKSMSGKRRQATFILSTAWLLLAIIGIWTFISKKNIEQWQIAQVVSRFQKLEGKANQYISDEEITTLLSQWSEGTYLPDDVSEKLITRLSSSPVVLGMETDGKLTAWTGNIHTTGTEKALHNGYYLVDDSIFQKKFTIDKAQDARLVAEFALPGKFSKENTGNLATLESGDGKLIAYFSTAALNSGLTGYVRMLPFYLAAYILLLIGLSMRLKKRRSGPVLPNIAIAIIIPTAFRLLDWLMGIGMSIDTGLINSGFTPKPILSEWYANWILIILLYFLIIENIIGQLPPIKAIKKYKKPTILFTTGLYTLDYLGLVGILVFCRELVLRSGINFDFNNVLNLGAGPLVSLILLALLLFRYFVFAYKINLELFKNRIKLDKKIYGMIGGFLLTLPWLLLLSLDLPLFILILVVLLFALLFDIFIGTPSPSLGWLVIWVFFFSAFATIALFKFNRDKDHDDRLALIGMLHQKEDSLLLSQFGEFVNILKNDRQNNSAMTAALLQRSPFASINTIQNILDDFEYIRQFYNVDFFVSRNDSLLLESRGGLKNNYESQGVKFREDGPYLFADQKKTYHGYWLRIYWQSFPQKPSPVITFSVTKKLFVPNQRDVGPNIKFMDSKLLNKYDYAIYYKDNLIESQGFIYPDNLNTGKIFANGGNLAESNTNNRSEIASMTGDGYVIIAGKNLMGVLKPISLCSFLIVILLLIVIIIAFLNSRFRILPEELPIFISGKFNLRQRIEYSIILVIVASFAIIAIVTGSYFKNLSFRMEESLLSEKAFAIVSDIESILGNASIDSIPEEVLRKVAALQQANFSLYSVDGKERFNTLHGPIRNNRQNTMSPVPYLNLYFGNKPVYFDLTSDKNSIRAVYVPVRKTNNQKSGWLAVPYLEADVTSIFAASDFLGTLLNVYVLLLLIAGGLAFFVANSVTKPLVRLMDNLRKIKLGKKNEQLTWDQQDEIGSLIHEYNKMIDQLEESTALLVKSEREGAWRDMAQQVAHEIKNPLTPMKLSIQYLERKIGSVPQEEMEQVVKDTARTIIEQIDNLASIATEFSNFAKMPAPIFEYINFNELVSSIHELFRKKDDIQFNLYVPIDDVIVVADKTHLMRLLNNLVQNAIQSIPPGRKGKIGLELKIVDDNAVLSVKDNGQGIPEDMHDKVFYPRFTTKSSGMGLGLAMCKSIVDSFNGTISFKSQPDVGTEFIVTIPLAKDNHHDYPNDINQ